MGNLLSKAGLSGRQCVQLFDFLTEVVIFAILALSLVAAKSISFWQSIVLFAVLCFFLIDALRPPSRVVAYCLVIVFAVGAVGFVARFLLRFPMTARLDLIQDRFADSLLHPFPVIWSTILIVAALSILYRGYCSAFGSSDSPLKAPLILFVSLVLYQIGLSSQLSIHPSGTTLSVPYASLLLSFAVVTKCAGSIGAPRSRLFGTRLARSLLAALAILALYLATLTPLLFWRYDFDPRHQLNIVGPLLGLVLFAGLLDSQLASGRRSQRFRLLLMLVMATAVVLKWSTVEMLPQIQPIGFDASSFR